MKKEKFKIKNRKGVEIVGNISIPESPKGLAFTIHGLSGHKEQSYIMVLVDSLIRYNYIVVNFDSTNSFNESGGKYEYVTMQGHYEDLIDVINWAKKQSWYIKPFVLAGHSLGGYDVVRYAEDYSNEVKAVFSYAAVVAGELSYKATEMFEPEKFKQWKETGWRIEESTSRPGLIKKLPWSHMEERLKHDLRPNASKLTMPILFIGGENDKLFFSGNHNILYNLASGEKEIHSISGAPHTFTNPIHLDQLRNIFNNLLKKIN